MLRKVEYSERLVFFDRSERGSKGLRTGANRAAGNFLGAVRVFWRVNCGWTEGSVGGGGRRCVEVYVNRFVKCSL